MFWLTKFRSSDWVFCTFIKTNCIKDIGASFARPTPPWQDSERQIDHFPAFWNKNWHWKHPLLLPPLFAQSRTGLVSFFYYLSLFCFLIPVFYIMTRQCGIIKQASAEYTTTQPRPFSFPHPSHYFSFFSRKISASFTWGLMELNILWSLLFPQQHLGGQKVKEEVTFRGQCLI